MFDKTGTLTEGKPQVVAVTTAGIAEADALRLAAALEQAQAIRWRALFSIKPMRLPCRR